MSEIELPPPAGRLMQCPDGWINHGADGYTAEQFRAAILAERERCALVCEELVALGEDGTREDRYAATAIACAAAIRRG